MDIKDLEDAYFKEFPAFDVVEVCSVEGAGNELPDCVWDENRPQDCSIADSGVKKTDCVHWVKRHNPNLYDPKDIWEWVAKRLEDNTWT